MIRTGRDLDREKATDFLYIAVYLLWARPRWLGGWALVSQDIMSVYWDHCHTQHIFPARVVSRTNRTIAPPTGTLRRREQDHRDQRTEEHIKAREQSGATARGRFTLERLTRLWLPCSDSRGLVPHLVPHLAPGLTTQLTTRLDSRVATYPAAVPSPLVSSVDSRDPSVDFRSLQLTHGRPWVRSPRRASRVTL